jgi:hypothetical protein
MAEIEKDNLWISGGYYVDFDELDQFRIIGPNNHLYCGLVDIPRHKIAINHVNSKRGGSVALVKGMFLSKSINLYYPAMDDIRTMRELSTRHDGGKSPFVSFLEIRRMHFDKLVPLLIQHRKSKEGSNLIFKRPYGDSWYKVTFEFSENIKVEAIKKPYKGYKLISDNAEIPFVIRAATNDVHKKKIVNVCVFCDFDFKVFGKYKDTVEKVYERTKIEIEHLITWGKTSGDRFGTIFPRDWMESADLGVHDLTQETRDYMYEATLKNVNEKGESWHEDVVGEYKYQHEVAGRDIFDRHMIDIEPHHIFGLSQLSQDFLLKKETRERLREVAKYVVKQARENQLITFKKLPKDQRRPGEVYYLSGNWRDSNWAYKKVHPVIAPFDVNAVFYPEALKALKNFQSKLGVEIKDLDKLIAKWDRVKDYYRFRNEDGTTAYALVLYDVSSDKKGKLKYKKMKANHLDESYLLTYCRGTKEEVKSFCRRLLSPKYFYTESGPPIIAVNNEFGYTTQEYHGLVIWTKQAAFTVLGLSKHLKIAITEEWPKDLQKLIRDTLMKTCLNMIRSFDKLNAIPELHYDDNGVPRHYTDQPLVGGRISRVQLWSAVGARRIIRKYYELMTEDRYKI